ncbi:hypothetical protein CGZ75_20855 [Paenibacillus herberti]|uniref:DoxX family protein n=2 Tax=Paenibacillus herberti TaxID=1619309 RepID=A0A229NVG3_9BACL|nr:hypothetical protein CGZ75_20855 [Paenibacillus herberti]
MIGLILFAVLMTSACVYHFREPDGFAAMLPDWVPLRLEIIYATAILELVIAILILIPATRGWTGLFTALYLVLIFPANLYAAAKGIPAPGSESASYTALWLRAAAQPLLIWWVLWCTRYPSRDTSLKGPPKRNLA